MLRPAKKSIESGKGNVSQKSKEVGNIAVGNFEKQAEAFRKGQNVSQGFANGIGSLMSSVRNAAANIAQQAMDAMQRKLDEHSPSKKTYKFGEFFTQGFNEGVEDSKNETIKVVSNYGQDVLDELNSNDFNNALDDIYSSMQRAVDLETGKISANVELGTASKNLSQMISANASFDGTIEVQANIDGEKVWENQQKISLFMSRIDLECLEFKKILASGYNVKEDNDRITQKFANGHRKQFLTEYTDVIITIDLDTFDLDTTKAYIDELTSGTYQYYSLKDKQYKEATFLLQERPSLTMKLATDNKLVDGYQVVLLKAGD